MLRSHKTAALAAAALFAFPAMAAAQQMTAATASDLNMRAGPGTNHQVVGVIPSGQPVSINECTANRTWCQLSFGGQTGWSSSRYLDITQTVGVAGPTPGTAPMAQQRVPGTVEMAGQPAELYGSPGPDGHYGQRRAGTSPFGFAGGALAGGLIAGWPGAIVGGTAGAFTDTATGFGEPGWTSSRGPMEVPTPY